VNRLSLSVITVVKDAPEEFSTTLASLAGVDDTGIEFIVVDSSQDRSAIPGLLADSHASYAWIEPAGVYEAMNHALSLAMGEYVWFLNAGDRLMSSDALHAVREAARDSSPTWLYAEVEMLDDRGRPMRTPAWDFHAEARTCFSRGHFPCHQGTFVRRNTLIALGGFDTSYRIVADYAVFLRLSQLAPPVHVAATVAAFQPGGMSSLRWREASREFHRARREILHPRGLMALREQWETWRLRTATTAYRALWAPGRPAHGLVRRFRAGPSASATSVR